MSNALEEIKRRCEVAGIDFEDDGSSVLIWFPRGRETYDLYVEGGPHAEWAVSLPFDDYVRLKGFEASWSRNHRAIECNPVLSDTNYSPLVYTTHKLMSAVLEQLDREQRGRSSGPRRVSFEPINALSISIGWCSDVHAFVQEASGYSADAEDLDVCCQV